MKSFLGLLALLACAWAQPDPIVCPRNPDGTCINTRYEYEYDCRYYWVCNEALNDCESRLFRCPWDDEVEYEFSDIIKECLHPDEANCDPPEIPEPEGVTAFFAALTQDWPGTNDQIVYDTVVVNIGDGLMDGTNFIANSTGVHFFSISAAFRQGNTVDVQMRSPDSPDLPGAIFSNSTSHDGMDMIYRDVLAEMTAGQRVYVSTQTPLASDAMMQTSWLGISLGDFMVNVVAFSAVRETPLHAELEPLNIPFEDVLVNVGGFWNTTVSFFRAPVDGIYYFSFSTGQIPGYECHVAQLADSGLYPQSEAELWKGIGNNNGIDMHSRAVLIHLDAGDRSWMALYEAGYIYSQPEHYQLTFSGFLYNPSRNPPIAWSVHRLSSWDNPGAGPLDPIIWEENTVNEWNMYDVNTGLVTIPITGYYFIQFNIGVEGGRPLDVSLYLNGNETSDGDRLLDVTVESTSHASYDNVGRACMFYLEQGDLLRMRAEADTAIFSTRERQTSWLGMLLYAWPPYVPTTPDTPTTPPPIQDPTDVDGFFVAMQNDWNETGYVEWDEIIVNMGPSFQPDEVTYSPVRPGVHFFSMSAGLHGGMGVEVHLEIDGDVDEKSTIFRNSTMHDDVDIIHRNSLVNLQAGQQVKFITSGSLSSDEGRQTSWTGFNLDNFFSTVVAFYVAKNNQLDEQNRVYMTDEVVDVGDNFNMTGSAFTAPVDGIYYFAYSVGQQPNLGSRVALRAHTDEFPHTECELWKRDTAHNGVDMHTKVSMRYMPAGYTVWLANMEGHLWSDPDNFQVSWVGFLYSPAKATNPVAWSLSRDRTWQGGWAMDPLPWEYVDVDEGDCFFQDNSTLIIPVSGYYYMEFNFGLLNGIGSHVTLYRGGTPDDEEDLGEVLADVRRDSTSHNAIDNAGRAMHILLYAGDELRFRAEAHTGVYSDMDRGTSWVGFLMYEI